MHRAKIDTVVEGKPYAAGAEIKPALDDKRAKSYVAAGLIEEDKGAEDEKLSKDEKQLLEDAKKIDSTGDKKLEK